MRARGFACRDGAADVLGGLYITEEAEDIPAEMTDITPRKSQAADAGPAITAAQAVIIRDCLEATSTSETAFLKHFKATSVADFPASKFDAAIVAFKQKKAQS